MANRLNPEVEVHDNQPDPDILTQIHTLANMTRKLYEAKMGAENIAWIKLQGKQAISLKSAVHYQCLVVGATKQFGIWVLSYINWLKALHEQMFGCMSWWTSFDVADCLTRIFFLLLRIATSCVIIINNFPLQFLCPMLPQILVRKDQVILGYPAARRIMCWFQYKGHAANISITKPSSL